MKSQETDEPSAMPTSEPRPQAQGEARVIALVAGAHYASHVMQLAVPMLFPILHEAIGVDFAALGLFATAFFAASGLGQTAAGLMVDRYGAERLLIGGLALLSAAILAVGLASAYWILLPLAFLAGLGNSVFHPADLSILSHRVREERLGRAYAVHNFAGSLGYATSPLIIPFIAFAADWRTALILTGGAGLLLAGALLAQRRLLASHASTAPRGASGTTPPSAWNFAVMRSPVMLMALAYFALVSFAGAGVQAFGPTALTLGYGLSLSAAAFAVSIYLVGSAGGILMGGFLADRTRRHHRVAMAGVAATSVLMLLLSNISHQTWLITPIMLIAGASNGLTAPSRDVLIRRTAQGAGLGSVFGFVYSGFDLGSATAPLLFGVLLDRHEAHEVFVGVAIAFAFAVLTVMQVQHRAAARTPAMTPAE
jgi:MFS transporter, FSR family, fosmidomycin resistance protein